MFGECHAHVIMDGMNYKAAVALHKNGVCQEAVRTHLEAYQKAGITFVRDGGDAWELRAMLDPWQRNMALTIGHRCLPHLKGHYGGIVGHPFADRTEYEQLVKQAKEEGADFIKIMVSGILDFAHAGTLTEPGLDREWIRFMIDTAHEARNGSNGALQR